VDKVRSSIRSKSTPERLHEARAEMLSFVSSTQTLCLQVGALLQIGQPSLAVTLVATAGVLLATINVFGGFAVTHRMLAMFRRS